MRRVWVRAPTWVGDVIMATPVLRALRARFPRAEIVLEGRPFFDSLVGNLPTLDRFEPIPARGVASEWAHARALRARGYDAAVLLPDSARAAIGPFLARVPIRIGYARDPLRRIMLTRALDPPQREGVRVPISMVERYLRIVRELGCETPQPGLDLVVRDEARERVDARLAALGVGRDDALVTLTPGAAFGSSKLWPTHHFARACELLWERAGLRPVLAPGPGEEAIAREIAEKTGAPAIGLIDPVIPIAELAALVERSRLLLTNDTGPRHMAVALGVPVVVVMGSTDPRHTDHLLERQRVLREDVPCSPCHEKVCPIDHRCMTRLEPERVVRAAAELLR